MNIRDAADICRPLNAATFRQRGPQDETLDLADRLISEERNKEAREVKEAGVSPVYRVAARQLEGIAVNLVAYSRGMVGREMVPVYIQQAREALDALEQAL